MYRVGFFVGISVRYGAMSYDCKNFGVTKFYEP